MGTPNVIDENPVEILLFSFNNAPVDNDKTSEFLIEPFHSKDRFEVGLVPAFLLKLYIPSIFYNRLLIDVFKENIEEENKL